MGSLRFSTLWINLIVISGTWGSSFVFVKLIADSMHPFAFAASRGFIAMSALLVWLALRGRTLPLNQGPLRHSGWKDFRHMIVLGSTNPAALACGQQACGAIIAALISVMFEPRAEWSQPASVWLLLVTVGVICSAVPTALYLRLLARAASVPAALVAYLQPVWATLLAWAILGEQISAVALLGAGIVVVGIVVTTGK